MKSITFCLTSVNASTINTNKTQMTFNVDFENLLGTSLYNEYEKFDVKLSSVCVLTGSATDANNNLIVKVQGLPFFGNNGIVPLGLIKSGNNLSSSITHLSSNPTHSIYKPSTTASITISLHSVATNALSAVAFGHQAYLFTIYAIK